jgi:hypothetical protein
MSDIPSRAYLGSDSMVCASGNNHPIRSLTRVLRWSHDADIEPATTRVDSRHDHDLLLEY